MSKLRLVPDFLRISSLIAVALCATLMGGTGNCFGETIRSVLAQSTPVGPQSPGPNVPAGTTQGTPASAPVGQPAAVSAGQAAAVAGSQATPPAGVQAASPAAAPSAPPGVVREKETRETKEIKDHPSDLVGVSSAVAWPVAIVLLLLILLFAIWGSRTIQQLFGIAISAVQKIEIAGVKLDIDTSVVDEVKKFVGGSLGKLMEKARSQYAKMARQFLVEERLAEVVRVGLRDILVQHGFAAWPDDLRATIHVPDIVFKDYMYQLVDYYPNAYRAKTAGRRLSQRFGIVGRAWRLQQSMGRGRAVSGPDASDQLVMYWGMQKDQADDRSDHRPATLCVMLIDAQDHNNRVGLLYIDSTAPDAFGVNPPPPPAIALGEAAVSAAQQAAQAVVQEAADVTVQHAGNRTTRAAAKAVIQAAKGAIVQAVHDAVARAAHDTAAEAVPKAASAAAAAVAQAARDAAAQAPAGAAAEGATAVAQAAADVVAQAAAEAAAAAAVAITADQVAEELQNHRLTRALARAVNQAMGPLRNAGPELDVTDLRYENKSA